MKEGDRGMNQAIRHFFEKDPAVLSLYLGVEDVIHRIYPSAAIDVQKTQIKFSNRHAFLYVWLPIHPVAHRPEHYLVLSFGLPGKIQSPRIAEAVEPYPNRWTHHVILEDIRDLDEELLGWIDESYRFSMTK